MSYYGDAIFIKCYVLHIYYSTTGSRMDGSSGIHPRNCFAIHRWQGATPFIQSMYNPTNNHIIYVSNGFSPHKKPWLPDFILLKLSDKYLNLHHHCHLVYNYVLFGKYMTVICFVGWLSHRMPLWSGSSHVHFVCHWDKHTYKP